MAEPTPVHAVTAVICDALTPLSQEERMRALQAAALMLGVELAPIFRPVTVPGTATAGTIHPGAAANTPPSAPMQTRYDLLYRGGTTLA